MAVKSGVLDYWRKCFNSTNADIFEVIEYAIIIASLDCPKELRMRRDRIAEKLFSCRLTRCVGCDRVEAAAPEEDEDGGCKDGFGGDGDFGRKESKGNSSTNEGGKMNRVSNYSYDEAEALTEEIEEESQIVGEVLRIKEILSNKQDESDNVLFELLRRLQLMELTVETLKATEIGKAVNGLRKHGSKQIRHLARALIDGWKDMVDQWVNAAAAVVDGSPDSVNPSTVVEEEGLPSPPLDEGAFLATQTTGMELSQFFDGMDDDGNPHNNGEFDKNRGNGRKPISENHIPKRKQQPPPEENMHNEDTSHMQRQEAVVKQTKPSNTNSGPGRPVKLSSDSGPGRPAKLSSDSGPGRPQKLSSDFGPGRPLNLSSERKANGDIKLQQRVDLMGTQKKQPPSIQDKSKYSDEVSVRVKLEAAKRKLQEGYQQAENAKKQRTIQVMELHDLPKQGLGHRNPQVKPGAHNRHWANGRR
ncbi:probable mediator of RNA polymerase II transcription subunit 26b [Magnolia sinica]|uniref:probable mediator of RNA polymerase II transcription subunit 26b n=1 Tax=Magnolia sinica TaxID=86752 RepID=UPI00265989A3|nr:probable mediator of RNA polymerase II transcription subunit 26b [Magnolia sinica]